MGMRGPGAKPLEVRQLEGTAGQVVAIRTTNAPAEVPEWLSDEARQVWIRVWASFPPGYFKACDEHHLGAYCTATVLWIQATKLMESGDDRPELAKQRAQAHTERVQMGDRLGIGPAKRTQSVAATSQGKKSNFFRPS